MGRWSVLALVAGLVACSLVVAPFTMVDRTEQAVFSVDQIDQTDIGSETPVLSHSNLSTDEQRVVQRAIESPDNSHTVYGKDNWPDRFFYSDHTAPGRGKYVIIYEGASYQLSTYASGGFAFDHGLARLAFIVYGLTLGSLAYRTMREASPRSDTALATVAGIGFHALGPTFDFPVFDPLQFAAVGILATLITWSWLGWRVWS